MAAGTQELIAQQFFSPGLPVTGTSSATPAANTENEVVTNGDDKSLEAYLLEQKDNAPVILSFVRTLLVQVIERGLSANMLVLLLLLPVVASLVAFSRHVIGLTGFSIYAPTGLAIVLLSTGILPGIILFAVMLLVGLVGKWIISFLKLEFVPRSAMLLWSVSLGLFAAILLSSFVPSLSAFRVDIFPLLLLVLLAEDFMAPQGGLKWGVIIERSMQIMFLAVIGAMIMGNITVQQFTLLNPEVVIVGVAVINFLTGRYLGLRLTEYFRFRPLMDAEE